MKRSRPCGAGYPCGAGRLVVAGVVTGDLGSVAAPLPHLWHAAQDNRRRKFRATGRPSYLDNYSLFYEVMFHSFARDVWPLIVKFGVPIWFICVLIMLLVFGAYYRTCVDLHRKANYLKKHQTLRGYQPRMSLGIEGVWFSFRRISKFEPIFTTHPALNEELIAIRSFRKLFRFVLPILAGIALAAYVIQVYIIEN